MSCSMQQFAAACSCNPLLTGNEEVSGAGGCVEGAEFVLWHASGGQPLDAGCRAVTYLAAREGCTLSGRARVLMSSKGNGAHL